MKAPHVHSPHPTPLFTVTDHDPPHTPHSPHHHHHHHHHHHDHHHSHDTKDALHDNDKHDCGGGCHDSHASGWRQYLPHSHGLERRLRADTKSLSIALVVVVCCSLFQLIGGIVAGSSVLRVEALHSMLDGLTVVISLVSVVVAARGPTDRFTYGFGRAEVLSALISVVALGLLCVKLMVQAVGRLVDVVRGTRGAIQVEGNVVFWAEVFALTCNMFMVWILGRREGGSLNMRALRAHVIADSVENSVVLFAGVLMWVKPGWGVVDPILTVVIVGVILVMNVGIATEAVEVLLQGVGGGLDMRGELVREVREVEGVRAVGRVHVWTLTSGRRVGSVVVVVEEGLVKGGWEAMERVIWEVQEVFEKLGVGEVTVQVERRIAGESGGGESDRDAASVREDEKLISAGEAEGLEAV